MLTYLRELPALLQGRLFTRACGFLPARCSAGPARASGWTPACRTLSSRLMASGPRREEREVEREVEIAEMQGERDTELVEHGKLLKGRADRGRQGAVGGTGAGGHGKAQAACAGS